MATHIDVIGSHNVARKVVEKLRLAENPKMQEDYQETAESYVDIRDWIADLLLKKLNINPSRESSLIDIGFKSVDPNFSALVANTFAEAFMQTTIELRAQPAKSNAEWFDEQLKSLKQRLEQAQAELSRYQQETGIVEIDARLDIENTRLNDLSKLLVESQGRTDELQSRKNLLSGFNIRDLVASESLQEVQNSPLVQSLKTELAKSEANFAELSKHLDKNHPQYKQARAQIDSLQQRINAEVKQVLNSMTSGLSSSQQRDSMLSKALAEQKSKVLKLKQDRDQVAVLSQAVDNAQLAYNTAVQRSVQTRMESEMSHTNVSILNPAIPPDKASSPKLLINLILSIFIGGMLGLGAALGLEVLNRRVRSEFDVAEVLGLPVLGVINARQEKARRWSFGRNASGKYRY